MRLLLSPRALRLCAFAGLIAAPNAFAQNEALRLALEHTYSLWRQAMMKGDAVAWQRHTAAFRRATTRNVMVSQKKPFPDALFELPMRPPNLAGLKFLATNQKGATAAAIYYGKIDFGTDEKNLPNNLLVVRFTKEADAWKYDDLSLINLAESPEVHADVRKGTLEFLDDPTFQASGRVQEPPPRCPLPDYVTDIHLISLGYESRVTINGVSTHTVTDNVSTELVMGGLKDGENAIRVQTKPLGPSRSSRRVLKISVHVKTGDQAHPAIKVYEFKPADPEKPLTLSATILANEKTLGRYAKP